VDRTLKRQRTRSICTALCLRLEPQRAILAVGGHPLPLVVTAEKVDRMGEYGPLLGGFAAPRWQDTDVDLEPGAALVSYTDGVTDAIGTDRTRYGMQRLIDTLDRCRGRCASSVVELVTNVLGTFQIGPHADDTAILVLRRLPAAPLRTASSADPRSEPVASSR
jgi:sigma-B regulation protein RsbU (phosphoserine phosphatase)